ncbi:tail fiber domain-containing protein [Paenochrobactrum pullorum]|uniref:tail fiber domain-containing protein n=1 Tax=Paenochrobactrum pullorum TaxID=1324351 RepID=UPI0035BBC1D8
MTRTPYSVWKLFRNDKLSLFHGFIKIRLTDHHGQGLFPRSCERVIINIVALHNSNAICKSGALRFQTIPNVMRDVPLLLIRAIARCKPKGGTLMGQKAQKKYLLSLSIIAGLTLLFGLPLDTVAQERFTVQSSARGIENAKQAAQIRQLQVKNGQQDSRLDAVEGDIANIADHAWKNIAQCGIGGGANGAGYKITWNPAGSGTWGCMQETDPTVKSFAKNDLPTCSAGQVLRSDGTKFICTTSSGTSGFEVDPYVQDFARNTAYTISACAADEVLTMATSRLRCVKSRDLSITETDPTVQAFAKTALPICSAGQVLTTAIGNGGIGVLRCVTDSDGGYVELDPSVGSITNNKWCMASGGKINCNQNPPVLVETDPKIGAMTNNSWCRAVSGKITCDQTAPTGGDNLGNHIATKALNMSNNNISGAPYITAKEAVSSPRFIATLTNTGTSSLYALTINKTGSETYNTGAKIIAGGTGSTTNALEVHCSGTGNFCYGIDAVSQGRSDISTGVRGRSNGGTSSSSGVVGYSTGGKNSSGVIGYTTSSADTVEAYGVKGYTNTPIANSYGGHFRNGHTAGYGLYCFSGSTSGCGGNRPWTNASDGRLKWHVTDLDEGSGLLTIMKLRPVTYQWRTETSGKVEYGFIAQEVEKIIPELVGNSPDTEITLEDGSKKELKNVKSLSYASFVVPLVKAVQELKAENDMLRDEVRAIQETLRLKRK